MELFVAEGNLERQTEKIKINADTGIENYILYVCVLKMNLTL